MPDRPGSTAAERWLARAVTLSRYSTRSAARVRRSVGLPRSPAGARGRRHSLALRKAPFTAPCRCPQAHLLDALRRFFLLRSAQAIDALKANGALDRKWTVTATPVPVNPLAEVSAGSTVAGQASKYVADTRLTTDGS